MGTDKKDQTHLKVVEEEVVPRDGKEAYADLRQQIIELKESIDQSRWQMAEALYQIHDNNIFHRWGYNNFGQYVETEIKMNKRTAEYLVSMYNWFVHKLGSQMEKEEVEKLIAKVRPLGWTKACCLIGVTTVDNVFEWIEKAYKLSSSELQSATRKALVEKKGGNPKDVKDMKRLNLLLADEQHAIVVQAIGLAEKIAESDKKSHLISLICQDFVATTMAQEDSGQKNRGKYFNKIAAMFGVKLIAVDIVTKKVVHNEKVLKSIKD